MAEESRLATTAVALRRRFGGERHQIILEAGPHSPWISRLLAELGHEVHVANPRPLQAIYLSENKDEMIPSRVDEPRGRRQSGAEPL